MLEIVAAVVIGAGVPLLWIWIGSLIQSSRGAQHVEGSTAAILVVGILVSYVDRPDDRRRDPGPRPGERATGPRPATRGTAACATSPTGPGSQKLSPVEAVFVGTAIVASIAMLIWFFAFAGSPLPT